VLLEITRQLCGKQLIIWVIDHKKPRILFNYINPEEQAFKDCWCLANLQPLEKITNIKKGYKFEVTLKK